MKSEKNPAVKAAPVVRIHGLSKRPFNLSKNLSRRLDRVSGGDSKKTEAILKEAVAAFCEARETVTLTLTKAEVAHVQTLCAASLKSYGATAKNWKRVRRQHTDRPELAELDLEASIVTKLEAVK